MKSSVSAALALWAVSAAAHAQSVDDNAFNAATGEQLLVATTPVRGEIVVTATRLPDSTLDVAATVDVLGRAALESIVPTHPAEVLNAVPGVNVQQGSGQEHLTAIRSPVLTGGAGAGSFLYLEDGVPTRAAGFGNVNGLFELGTEFAAAVEIFKGPGSVLYGSNAQHGLVNVLSRAPDGSGSARVIVSDDGQAEARASWSDAETRLSLDLAHDDGFRADSGFDQQKFQWRQNARLGAWDLSALTSVQNLNQETAGFLQEGPDAFRDRELIETNAFPEAFRDAWSARVQARLSREAGFGSVALTPYVRASEIEFLRHFVPGQALERQRHWSVGALSTLYAGEWIAGVDAEYTRGSLFEFQDDPTRFSFVQGLHYDYDVEAVVLSPYAQREVTLGPRTTVTAGARLDYTRYAYGNNADVATVGRFQRIADRADDFLTLTPKLTLAHRARPSLTLFGRLARGARAPQTADLYSLQVDQVAGEIDPETLDSAEIGLKWRGARTRLDVSAFAMRKDNFFFRNANGFNVTNGKTEHLGVEIDAVLSPAPWLDLAASLTVADQDYAFTDIVGSASSTLIQGNEIDTAPTTLGRLAATARPLEALSLFAELRHVGAYFTDPGNTRDYPGHEVVNARVGYGLDDGLGGVELFAKINNVFDTRYADRADFAFGNDRYFPGRPRHVLFGVEVAWD